MFIHGLSAGQGWWLLGLLALWAGLLFGGFAFGRPNDRNTRRMPAWTRLGSSLTLVVAGWSWYAFSREGGAAEYALLVALGVTLGLVGDLFMAGWWQGLKAMLGGMTAFGLGHAVYIAAFLRFGDRNGLHEPALRWPAWAVWLLVGVAGWYLVVLRGRRPTRLRWPALLYVLVLASTAGCATGLALQAPAFVPLAAGAALFLASDLILAAERFAGARFNLIKDWIWLTYGPAQMLIVYSVWAARWLVAVH